MKYKRNKLFSTDMNLLIKVLSEETAHKIFRYARIASPNSLSIRIPQFYNVNSKLSKYISKKEFKELIKNFGGERLSLREIREQDLMNLRKILFDAGYSQFEIDLLVSKRDIKKWT